MHVVGFFYIDAQMRPDQKLKKVPFQNPDTSPKNICVFIPSPKTGRFISSPISEVRFLGLLGIQGKKATLFFGHGSCAAILHHPMTVQHAQEPQLFEKQRSVAVRFLLLGTQSNG